MFIVKDDDLIINKEEWELAPFKFNVSELNFVSGGGDTPTSNNRLITADNKYFITSDNNNFLVKE